MHAVIYCRVSSKEQVENFSLETQEEQCRRYCEKHGLTVEKVFVEPGVSAKTLNRPVFQELLHYCERHRKRIRAVVCYAIDRASRETKDFLEVWEKLRRWNIAFTSVTQPIDDSPEGKFSATLLVANATYDNDRKGRTSKLGMQEAFRSGRWVWRAPIGYISDEGYLRPDPFSGPLIRRAFKLRAEGWNQRQIRDWLVAQGVQGQLGGTLSSQTVNSMFRRTVYKGEMFAPKWNLKVQGCWEPLVDPALFDSIQPKSVNGKRIYKVLNPDFPLRHFLRCEKCGLPLTASKSTGSKGGRYPYYRCRNRSCGAVQCRAERIEAMFAEFLKQIEPRPETSSLLTAIVKDLVLQRTEESRREMRRLNQGLADLESRKSIVLEAYIYQKKIDGNTYERECARLDQQVEAKRQQLSAISGPELWDRVLEGLSQLLNNASANWRQFPAALKRRFQGVMFPKGVTYADGRFGTGKMCPFLGLNGANMPALSEMASPTGFEDLWNVAICDRLAWPSV